MRNIKDDSLEDFEHILEGLSDILKNKPNLLEPWHNDKEWFNYTVNSTLKVAFHIREDRVYLGISEDGCVCKSSSFSALSMKNLIPFSKRNRRVKKAFSKFMEILHEVNGKKEELSTIDKLFPNLAQVKLEEAVWGENEKS